MISGGGQIAVQRAGPALQSPLLSTTSTRMTSSQASTTTRRALRDRTQRVARGGGNACVFQHNLGRQEVMELQEAVQAQLSDERAPACDGCSHSSTVTLSAQRSSAARQARRTRWRTTATSSWPARPYSARRTHPRLSRDESKQKRGVEEHLRKEGHASPWAQEHGIRRVAWWHRDEGQRRWS